jgi:hypothetical protein
VAERQEKRIVSVATRTKGSISFRGDDRRRKEISRLVVWEMMEALGGMAFQATLFGREAAAPGLERTKHDWALFTLFLYLNLFLGTLPTSSATLYL